ncbi:hypothetical protein Tco_1145225 [Tanacetum coccineum]
MKSNSLPHAHAQTIKTYYKHRDSRIMKAQELKTKTSAQTLIYKIFLQRYQVYQGRLLASFQDDAKYEHVGQDTRSQVKNYEDEDDCFIDFETEFPAIVFDNTTLPSEPTVCPPNENKVDFRISLDESDDEDYTNVLRFNDLFNIIRPDDLKSEKDNDDNDIDIIQSSEGNETTPEANGLSETNMAPLPAADQRHPWLRYQDLAVRLRMVYTREGQQVFMSHTWRRLFGIRAPLVYEFILEFLSTCRMSDTEIEQEMAEAGFGAYWDDSDRLIPDIGDLKDYWIEISSDRDFLGLAPSYVLIRDPVRILCHRMIAYSISARYLFRYAEGRKNGARLSGGHFIGRLAMHFSLVSDEGLRGLQVVTRELLLIDLHEVGRLNICSRFGDTWAWVAQGPERKQAATAGAHEADEAGPVAKEGAQEILALAQACKELSRALLLSSLESPPG